MPLPDPIARVSAAVAKTIRGLTLPGLPPERVYERIWDGSNLNIMYPCVVVSINGLPLSYRPGVSQSNDLGIPIRAMVMDTVDRIGAADIARYTGWEWTIGAAFNGVPLAGVPESMWCDLETFAVMEWEAENFQRMKAGHLIRCWCRVPLGN